MQQTIEELILKEIGGEALVDGQKQEMLDDIAESVQNYFIAFCYQKLGEEDKVQLEQLIDAGDDAAQDEFLKTKLANHADILQQAVDQTVRDIKESQAELDEELKDLEPTTAPAADSSAPTASVNLDVPAPSTAILTPVAPPTTPPNSETIAQQVPTTTMPVPPVDPAA